MEQHCKECRELKPLSEYYTHPQWRNWVLGRCKECIKKWRRSEKERKMARIIDKKRVRPEGYATKRCQINRKKFPEKYNATRIVNNYFRWKNKEKRPNKCVYCNYVWKIELHHFDYNKPNEVIPLCSLCHSWYHYWKIEIDLTKKINIYDL